MRDEGFVSQEERIRIGCWRKEFVDSVEEVVMMLCYVLQDKKGATLNNFRAIRNMNIVFLQWRLRMSCV